MKPAPLVKNVENTTRTKFFSPLCRLETIPCGLFLIFSGIRWSLNAVERGCQYAEIVQTSYSAPKIFRTSTRICDVSNSYEVLAPHNRHFRVLGNFFDALTCIRAPNASTYDQDCRFSNWLFLSRYRRIADVWHTLICPNRFKIISMIVLDANYYANVSILSCRHVSNFHFQHVLSPYR